MYLLHAVRQGARLTASDESDAQRQRRELRERWHVLKQYKCDPWQEFDTFEHKLQRSPAMKPDVTKKPTFDIGRFVQTHSWRGWDNEALAAYNFLRFCEDAGIPFRASNCTIATKSATRTLPRIAHDTSYWALATLVRIDDTKAVGEIFDRVSLAGMGTPTVDSLIERYLESLRLAVPDIATGDRRRNAKLRHAVGQCSSRDLVETVLQVFPTREGGASRLAYGGLWLREQVELQGHRKPRPTTSRGVSSP